MSSDITALREHGLVEDTSPLITYNGNWTFHYDGEDSPDRYIHNYTGETFHETNITVGPLRPRLRMTANDRFRDRTLHFNSSAVLYMSTARGVPITYLQVFTELSSN
jgi:hypothetical protein